MPAVRTPGPHLTPPAEARAMKRAVLLVEPAYKTKYPPLGLMKLARYHKDKGDHVEFIKGLCPDKRDKLEWDRVYVSSLFTYDWAQTLKAIRYYRYSTKEPCSENLVLGGVLATLMGQEIVREVPCKTVSGLLDERGKLGYDDDGAIDELPPDYSILDETPYVYESPNAYIAYATRGCPRRCEFCAVHRIEPRFRDYVPIGHQIAEIEKEHGPKKDLLLLDNNVLASRDFAQIVQDIKAAGFERGAQFSYTSKAGRTVTAQRRVDFNQGLDARLLTEEKLCLLSEIALRPLRLAFDDIAFRELYEEKVRMAAKHGMKYLSNYILFNYKDKPEDFYHRLRINVELNQELGLQIFSFPMRYVDLSSKDRRADSPGNIGQHWNRKYLRAIQAVLVATRGVVGTRMRFFEKAFGRDLDEFFKILLMPEDYIRHRLEREADGTTELWWQQFNDLSDLDREHVLSVVLRNNFPAIDRREFSRAALRVLKHYVREWDAQLSMFDTHELYAEDQRLTADAAL